MSAPSTLRLGNAPVSWGVYGPDAPHLPYARFLDAVAHAGYAGTELGPYGYFPTDPAALGRELSQRGLALGSSYVGVALEDPARRQAAVDECLRVGRLLATQGVREVIVADDDHPERMARAGRVPADGSLGWSDAEWSEAVKTLHAIASALKAELDMGVVVHHHVGTFLETPAEIAELMQRTDPALVNLLLDTGHVVYGGGDPAAMAQELGARIRYVHLKDVKAQELAHVRQSEVHMREAWKRGVFCALGEGVVDFPRVVEALRRNGYAGWVIVEQDVVPDAQGRLSPDPFECARRSRDYCRDVLGI
jgi:inosose dehydratase